MWVGSYRTGAGRLRSTVVTRAAICAVPSPDHSRSGRGCSSHMVSSVFSLRSPRRINGEIRTSYVGGHVYSYLRKGRREAMGGVYAGCLWALASTLLCIAACTEEEVLAALRGANARDRALKRGNHVPTASENQALVHDLQAIVTPQYTVKVIGRSCLVKCVLL